MAASGKVNGTVRARIAHWKAFGLGRNAIASKLAEEGHTVTGRTVSRVLAGLGAAPPALPPAGHTAAPSPADRGAAVADTVAAELEAGLEDAADVLVALRARLAQVQGIADELAPLSKQGGRNAAVYATIVRLEGDLAARVRELTPPPAPDPHTDPANLAAKTLLIATIEGLLAGTSAEAES